MVSAFAFPATVNFLLGCALETESSAAGLAQSTSFRIARDLIATLRRHQQEAAGDLADSMPTWWTGCWAVSRPTSQSQGVADE